MPPPPPPRQRPKSRSLSLVWKRMDKCLSAWHGWLAGMEWSCGVMLLVLLGWMANDLAR